MKKYIYILLFLSLFLFLLGMEYVKLSLRENFTLLNDSINVTPPITPNTLLNKYNVNSSYRNDTNMNSYDIIYHDSPKDIQSQSNMISLITERIKDNNGNSMDFVTSNVQGYPTYYIPGSYPYNSNNWVPTYEDSIYLSNSKEMKFNNSNIIRPFHTYNSTIQLPYQASNSTPVPILMRSI